MPDIAMLLPEMASMSNAVTPQGDSRIAGATRGRGHLGLLHIPDMVADGALDTTAQTLQTEQWPLHSPQLQGVRGDGSSGTGAPHHRVISVVAAEQRQQQAQQQVQQQQVQHAQQQAQQV